MWCPQSSSNALRHLRNCPCVNTCRDFKRRTSFRAADRFALSLRCHKGEGDRAVLTTVCYRLGSPAILKGIPLSPIYQIYILHITSYYNKFSALTSSALASVVQGASTRIPHIAVQSRRQSMFLNVSFWETNEFQEVEIIGHIVDASEIPNQSVHVGRSSSTSISGVLSESDRWMRRTGAGPGATSAAAMGVWQETSRDNKISKGQEVRPFEDIGHISVDFCLSIFVS